MIVLGLLLLAAAAAFGIDLVATNAHQVTSPAVFGQTIAVHTDWSVFLIGAITGAVALLGLALMMGGAGRGMRRRRMARRDEEAAAERERFASENQGLLAERDRFARENKGLVAERDQRVTEHQQVLAERDRLAEEIERHRASAAGAGVAGRDEHLIHAGSATDNERLSGGEPPRDERVAARDEVGAAGHVVDVRDVPAAGEPELADSGRKRHFWER